MLQFRTHVSLFAGVLVVLSATNVAQAQKFTGVVVDVPLVGIDVAETPNAPKQQPSDYLTLIGYRLDIGYGSPSEGIIGNYENVVWETYEYYTLEEELDAWLQYDLFLLWLSEFGVMPSLEHPEFGTYGIAVRLVPLFAIHGSATPPPTQQMKPQLSQFK